MAIKLPDDATTITTVTADLINRFLAVAHDMLDSGCHQPCEIAGAMIVALDEFSKCGMKDAMTEAERHEEIIFMLNNSREIRSIH